MPLTISFALALSGALGVSQEAVQAAPLPPPQAQTIRQQVEEYFADLPVMVAIAKCESHFRQFDKNGDIYRGKVNNKDVGVMQINERYHLNTADKMEIDISTLEGNLEYARYLYEKEGTTPWASSQACWGKTDAGKIEIALASK